MLASTFVCVCVSFSLPPFPLQGILAGNIFDWGAKACVELYTNGTILDMFAEVGGEWRCAGAGGGGGAGRAVLGAGAGGGGVQCAALRQGHELQGCPW